MWRRVNRSDCFMQVLFNVSKRQTTVEVEVDEGYASYGMTLSIDRKLSNGEQLVFCNTLAEMPLPKLPQSIDTLWKSEAKSGIGNRDRERKECDADS
ncbi:hypothetical protein Pr1d_34980 [Bythopirellula goksoeyrii]|uniref:Uncharacterized protein n=1 Tax=Bythopirellula goksoeyrii TaxID=1400387 RepID=A0A5B9QE95_9BACT|nr:hypothetical protein Pr1d_34980 [Bythopirellula goksoeyrii]